MPTVIDTRVSHFVYVWKKNTFKITYHYSYVLYMNHSKHYSVLQERSLLLYPNQKRTSRLGELSRWSVSLIVWANRENFKNTNGWEMEVIRRRMGDISPGKKNSRLRYVYKYIHVNLNIKVWAHSITIVLWEASITCDLYLYLTTRSRKVNFSSNSLLVKGIEAITYWCYLWVSQFVMDQIKNQSVNLIYTSRKHSVTSWCRIRSERIFQRWLK